jgi:indole-3-glycerol phosphate synthase
LLESNQNQGYPSTVATILDRIVARKRQEIESARSQIGVQQLERLLDGCAPVHDFRAALDRPGQIQIIAEVKKASPSAGILREDFDPVGIARVYAAHGAAAVSVLTDEPFFQGTLAHLSAIRAAVSLPLLRKDFVLDRYQLLQARIAGADAVLLIAEILPGAELQEILHQAWELGLEALVELYDAENLPRVLDSGARVIGVNNRDLKTFVTRLDHTLELAAKIPSDRLVVSESGIKTREDIVRLERSGVKAVLAGEVLMRARDIGVKLDELRGFRRGPGN